MYWDWWHRSVDYFFSFSSFLENSLNSFLDTFSLLLLFVLHSSFLLCSKYIQMSIFFLKSLLLPKNAFGTPKILNFTKKTENNSIKIYIYRCHFGIVFDSRANILPLVSITRCDSIARLKRRVISNSKINKWSQKCVEPPWWRDYSTKTRKKNWAKRLVLWFSSHLSIDEKRKIINLCLRAAFVIIHDIFTEACTANRKQKCMKRDQREYFQRERVSTSVRARVRVENER